MLSVWLHFELRSFTDANIQTRGDESMSDRLLVPVRKTYKHSTATAVEGLRSSTRSSGARPHSAVSMVVRMEVGGGCFRTDCLVSSYIFLHPGVQTGVDAVCDST